MQVINPDIEAPDPPRVSYRKNRISGAFSDPPEQPGCLKMGFSLAGYPIFSVYRGPLYKSFRAGFQHRLSYSALHRCPPDFCQKGSPAGSQPSI